MTDVLAVDAADVSKASTATLAIPAAVPASADEVAFAVQMESGVGPSKPVTLPVQRP